ncbi:N-acetylglucosamine-6-phosphate deacetylase [Deinococcus fonticola]|uniref:N-acetylglucosamine-6-phosphate deacetylase n=1 Tax=Deinococcus fonticola TaxID=2528713 RepID=UPI0010754CD9|nr:N-acetylglucosamine-6-phosphate deacetylase [Deinococcus fonticola]
MAQILEGQLVLPDGTVRGGQLEFTGTITRIELDDRSGGPLILPGFIDTHVHGGGGGDTMDGVEGLHTLARLHARHGTTTLLPTTMTNPWPNVLNALQAVKEVMDAGGVPGGADIAGAHLEGPFISPQRLGAQPPCTVLSTPERVAQVLAFGVIRALTIAPEQKHAFEAAETFARAGVRVGVGHTVADANTVSRFLNHVQQAGGHTCATHLFNAMGGIQGREPGVPAALMSDPHTFLEVILDLVHVHPTSFRLACAAAPDRTLLITDAMRAAGMGDGLSELGGQAVIVKNGEAHLESGSLAGSVLTMDVAFRNAVQAGFTVAQASRMASAVPAASTGLTDRGELRGGLRADLVLLDEKLNVQGVMVGGQALSLA